MDLKAGLFKRIKCFWTSSFRWELLLLPTDDAIAIGIRKSKEHNTIFTALPLFPLPQSCAMTS